MKSVLFYMSLDGSIQVVASYGNTAQKNMHDYHVTTSITVIHISTENGR